jgi:hypothetical protein
VSFRTFEQWHDAALDIRGLLDACPRLTMLVPRRVALHLAGEQAYLVTPLPLPQDGGSRDGSELEAIPAVRLFAQRARAARVFGTTSAVGEALPYPHPPGEVTRFESVVSGLREALGAGGVAAA